MVSAFKIGLLHQNILHTFKNQQTISTPTRGGIHDCATPSSSIYNPFLHFPHLFFSQKTRPAKAQHCNYAGDFLHRISEFQKPPVIQTQVAFFRAVMGFVVMGWRMIWVPCAIKLCQIALNTQIEKQLLIHKRTRTCPAFCVTLREQRIQLNPRKKVTIETQNINQSHSQALLTSHVSSLSIKQVKKNSNKNK